MCVRTFSRQAAIPRIALSTAAACLVLLFPTPFLALAFSPAAFAAAAASSSPSSSAPTSKNDDSIDLPALRKALSMGRVYIHPHYITETQVSALLSEMDELSKTGKLVPSGLSDTTKKTLDEQGFGDADRSVCPVPWWADSLLLPSSEGGDALSEHLDRSDGDDAASRRREVAAKLQTLRVHLSRSLSRPTMSNPSLPHESYYSRSAEGSSLPRHMDERHEETKGSRGWLLPSRRSVSWLIYLSDEDWDESKNGGSLRYFPQRRVAGTGDQRGEGLGCHDGNLQVGWLLGDDEVPSVPVYMDSWHKAMGATGEVEPHCILYRVTSGNAKDPVTKPFLSDSILGMAVTDYLKAVAASDASVCVDDASPSDDERRRTNLFLTPNEASRFVLLEDRTIWDEGSIPPGSFSVDVAPERGTLVMFDSVSVPHEVSKVKRGTRAALAGWFHEETQPFPEGIY